MLAEVGLRAGRRRDLAGRLPGFALLTAVPTLEMGTGSYPRIDDFAEDHSAQPKEQQTRDI